VNTDLTPDSLRECRDAVEVEGAEREGRPSRADREEQRCSVPSWRYINEHRNEGPRDRGALCMKMKIKMNSDI